MVLNSTQKTNLQHYFNKAWERAKFPVVCKKGSAGYYRKDGDANNMSPENVCFIGAGIPPEDYKPEIEKQMILDIANKYHFKVSAVKISIELDGLQEIHDRYESEKWLKMLINYAKKYNLSIPQ